jgi:hypothetical protein
MIKTNYNIPSSNVFISNRAQVARDARETPLELEKFETNKNNDEIFDMNKQYKSYFGKNVTVSMEKKDIVALGIAGTEVTLAVAALVTGSLAFVVTAGVLAAGSLTAAVLMSGDKKEIMEKEGMSNAKKPGAVKRFINELDDRIEAQKSLSKRSADGRPLKSLDFDKLQQPRKGIMTLTGEAFIATWNNK